MPTLVEKPPEGDAWIHEVEFDGYWACLPEGQHLGRSASTRSLETVLIGMSANAGPLLDHCLFLRDPTDSPEHAL
ncbi:hypothetical protein NKH84_29665 [Mesorhizobium sp. M0902]|uniref:hypothetical protein n=1 Tax=unclassified Mesorhizobium TaxID=325217 RepID=UPI003337DB3B